jgi:hypothetical protein
MGIKNLLDFLYFHKHDLERIENIFSIPKSIFIINEDLSSFIIKLIKPSVLRVRILQSKILTPYQFFFL